MAAFHIPKTWPTWQKVCGAKRKSGPGTCKRWAVLGLPTCKFHGSGGTRNAELGQLRYLCWVITGGPQNMPVAQACKVALTAFFETVINKGNGSPNQQMKAALWLTSLIDNTKP